MGETVAKKKSDADVEPKRVLWGESEAERRAKYGVNRKEKVQHIECDEMVMAVNEKGKVVDVEAEAARTVLLAKLDNTQREIHQGLMLATYRYHTRKAADLAPDRQTAILELIADKVKDKLEDVIGGFLSFLTMAKTYDDSARKAQLESLRAATMDQLQRRAIDQIDALFASYRKELGRKVSDELAVDLVKSGETSEAWIDQWTVAERIDAVVAYAIRQSGELRAREHEDAVQTQLHPEPQTPEKPRGGAR